MLIFHRLKEFSRKEARKVLSREKQGEKHTSQCQHRAASACFIALACLFCSVDCLTVFVRTADGN